MSVKTLAAILVIGVLGAVLGSIALAGLSENMGWLPGARLRHEFGVAEGSGCSWSVEVSRNWYVTEVAANPFAKKAEAEEHMARSRKTLGTILGGEENGGHAIGKDFELPTWQVATGTTIQVPNADPNGKISSSVMNRAFGFPLRFGHWVTVRDGTSSRTMGVLRLGPLGVPTNLLWVGLGVDVLAWSVPAALIFLSVRSMVRRIRRARPTMGSHD